MIILTNADMCKQRAFGAWPNGTIARKVHSCPDDAHQDGARCRVVGSMRVPFGVLYFVLWDDMTEPVALVADKLAWVG
jgi:hypothetical protein